MNEYTNKKYEDVVKKGCYGVLYNNTFGGFSISKEGYILLYEKFPEKDLIIKWEEYKNNPYCNINNIRADQDIIKYMLDIGLSKFEDKHCHLFIENIPIGIKYSKSEYDGREYIKLTIDHKLIINDLCVRIAKMETLLYENGIRDISTIGKDDTCQYTKDIVQKGYDKYINELNELCSD